VDFLESFVFGIELEMFRSISATDLGRRVNVSPRFTPVVSRYVKTFMRQSSLTERKYA
jgi:hypothetical protein